MDRHKEDKWKALATVKSFDLGKTQDNSRESVLQESIKQINITKSVTSTPISLLVQSLIQQLCSLLEKDNHRATELYNNICEKLHSMNMIDDSYDMGEFEAIRTDYQRALYHLVAVSGSPELPKTLPRAEPMVKACGPEWSRYHREFEELLFIAEGGFGSVFKARHKLDGVEYAIKKVYIKCADTKSIMSYLDEVKTIASLNHPNIVNYKAAWLEPMMEPNAKKNHRYHVESEIDDSLSLSSVHPNLVTSFKTHNSNELTNNKSQSQSQSDFVIFENSKSLDDNSNEETDKMDTSSDDDTKLTQDDNALCKFFSRRGFENSRGKLKWATLYIQMTLCQQTLKQWLDGRNNHNMIVPRKSSDSAPLYTLHDLESPDVIYPMNHVDILIDMFTQLVNGLHYIHSRGVIHHDVKPCNVFVATGSDGSLTVQLGDFGLACPLQQQSHSGLALGTQLYAAPEQLEGQCNPMSDMYSLGIILFEMINPFSTGMERSKIIGDLRKGQIPAHLTANYPKIAHIIGKLIQRRPTKRLNTTQLLEELKNISENKDNTIKTLKEELAAKDDEIAKLKMMLAKLNKA